VAAGQGQAETGSILAPRWSAAGGAAEKAFEDPFVKGRRDSRSVVGHGYEDRIRAQGRFNRNAAFLTARLFAAVLNGVFHKIEEGFPDLLARCLCYGERNPRSDKTHAVLAAQLLGDFADFDNEFLEVHVAESGRRSRSVQTVEGEKPIHDAPEP
jgi:hypothetical protein